MLKTFLTKKLAEKKIKRRLPPAVGIDKCLDPKEVYKIIDAGVEIVVRRMLDLPRGFGPVVINGPVLIIAYWVSIQAVKTATIAGVDVVATQFLNDVLRVALGLVTSLLTVAFPWM